MLPIEVWKVISGILAGIAIGGLIMSRAGSAWVVAAIGAVLLVIHVWGWL